MTFKPLLLVMAMTLAGCSMIPDYQRPEAPIPQAFPQGAAMRSRRAHTPRKLAGDHFSKIQHCIAWLIWLLRTIATCAKPH